MLGKSVRSKALGLLQEHRALSFAMADIVLISFGIYLAFFLRFDSPVLDAHIATNMLALNVLALVLVLPSFLFFRVYSFSWTYFSVKELFSLVKALSLAFLLLGASLFVLRDTAFISGFPRSTFFISFALVLLFCGGMRSGKRIYLEINRREPKGRRTLVVGAGDAGEQVVRNIASSKEMTMLPVGFVDDDPAKLGRLIHGIEVLGSISDIPKIVATKKIDELLVAAPSVGPALVKRAVELGRNAGLKMIKILPSINEVMERQTTLGDLREFRVEDLLGREQVSADTEAIEDLVRGKVILVTGAAGSIGSELCRQLAGFKPAQLNLLERDETRLFFVSEELKGKYPALEVVPVIADILDENKMSKTFEEIRPHLVFHAAAYKHVPLMEMAPVEAVKNNIFGTKIVGELSSRFGAEKFVFVSTDKAVDPTSVMGATKRVGEMMCLVLNNRRQNSQTSGTKFMAVRFGNVLDSRGNVISVFREQIKNGGPVTITHPEMHRYFMTTSEACQLILRASVLCQGGEVFVLDMGEQLRLIDVAREMIRFSGLEPDKDIAIVFIGPRPGEKLAEKLFRTNEEVMVTKNHKILKALLSSISEDELDFGLRQLRTASDAGDGETVIEILKRLIPWYGPGSNLISHLPQRGTSS